MIIDDLGDTDILFWVGVKFVDLERCALVIVDVHWNKFKHPFHQTKNIRKSKIVIPIFIYDNDMLLGNKKMFYSLLALEFFNFPEIISREIDEHIILN